MAKAELYQNLMDQVSQKRAAGQSPVVVFDLDATLFDVGPRFWHIFHDYTVQYKDDALSEALKTYRKRNLPYLLKDILSEMNLVSEDRLTTLTSYWFDRFFTDHYQHFDEPMPGASSFVRARYGGMLFRWVL